MKILVNPIKLIILRLILKLSHKKIFNEIDRNSFEFIISNFYNNLSSLTIKELFVKLKKK